MKSHELYPAVTMHWNDFMAPHVHMCFQRVTYETKRPTHDLRMMADVEGGVVKPGKEVEWKEQIIVPALPQSSLAGCDLIKIEYYVKVRLITSSRLLDNCLIDTMSECGMGCLPLHTNKLGRMSMRFRSEFMETLDLFPGEHLRSGTNVDWGVALSSPVKFLHTNLLHPCPCFIHWIHWFGGLSK